MLGTTFCIACGADAASVATLAAWVFDLKEELARARLRPDVNEWFAVQFVSLDQVPALVQGVVDEVKEEGGNVDVRQRELVRQGDVRTQLNACLATLSIGMQILHREEVRIDSLVGHGGLFERQASEASLPIAPTFSRPVSAMGRMISSMSSNV